MSNKQQSSIDDTLQKILEKSFEAEHYDYNATIAQIKQAFADEGYRPYSIYTKITRKEGETVIENGLQVMTGQEWYDRFLREYHNKADWISADPAMGDDAEHDVLVCARLAAGITEATKPIPYGKASSSNTTLATTWAEREAGKRITEAKDEEKR